MLVATVACAVSLAFIALRLGPAIEVSQAASAVMLLLVMVAGLLISWAISRLRRETARARLAQAEAEARQGTTETLYQLSSALSRARTPA